MHADGVTTAQIAAQYGVKEQLVRQRLRRHGVVLVRPPRPQPHKRSQAEADALIERYAAGETLTEIGQELGSPSPGSSRSSGTAAPSWTSSPRSTGPPGAGSRSSRSGICWSTRSPRTRPGPSGSWRTSPGCRRDGSNGC